jgi:hypothetical protein
VSSTLVRGHCSVEQRKIGSDWLGFSRMRLWPEMLTSEADYEDWGLKHYSIYQLHILKFVVSIHFPALLRNVVVKASGRDW